VGYQVDVGEVVSQEEEEEGEVMEQQGEEFQEGVEVEVVVAKWLIAEP
jgi:hypothetical protein